MCRRSPTIAPSGCKLIALFTSVAHRRPDASGCSSRSTPRGRLPVRQPCTRGSSRGGSPGTSASTASRCSSCVLTGVLFPLVVARHRPAPRPQALPGVDAVARGRHDRARSSASTCSCSSSSSRSCSCRCTSSSAGGATRTASTRPRSSSCSRWSARRSCSSASSPRRSWPSATRGHAHVRPRRDRRQAEVRAVARADGCSSPSPIAFAVKVPIFPLHTWLPDAHTAGADRPARSILAGVMLKLGTYGLLRFGVYLFPEAARWSSRRCCSTLGGDRHHLRRDRRPRCRRT